MAKKKTNLPALVETGLPTDLGTVDKGDFINYYTSNMEEALHSRGEELVIERKALGARLKDVHQKADKEQAACAEKAVAGIEGKVRKAIATLGVISSYSYYDSNRKNELTFGTFLTDNNKKAGLDVKSDGHNWMQTKPVKIIFTKLYKALIAEEKTVGKLLSENAEEQTRVIEALGSMERYGRRARAALSKMNLEKTQEGKAMIKMLENDLAKANIKPARALELAGPHFPS